MKRRSFIQSLGATVTLPVLPVSTLAAGAPAKTSAGALYWAKYLARYHPQTSPQHLQSLMGLSEAGAKALWQNLVRQNVISATGVANAAMAGFRRSVSLHLHESSPGTEPTLSDRLAKMRTNAEPQPDAPVPVEETDRDPHEQT